MKIFYDDSGRIRSWASHGEPPAGLHAAEVPDGIDPMGFGYIDGELVALPQDPGALAREARARRAALLAASDWTQVADAPVESSAWAAYRQALRDIPDQPGFPENINWPAKPE